MDDDFDRIHKKLDKIDDRLGSIDVTLAKQAVSLDEHIKRTNLLEKKLEPVERHVMMVNGVLKFLGVLAIMATIIEVIARLAGK